VSYLREENKLQIAEKEFLRKMCGPKDKESVKFIFMI
jgi:hypothetical protein